MYDLEIAYKAIGVSQISNITTIAKQRFHNQHIHYILL